VPRIASRAVVLLSLSLTTVSGLGLAPQQRDSTPQPQVRRVPVGTATISGTVTSADGRPVSGARVSVNGTMTLSSARSGGPAMPPGVSVQVGIAMGRSGVQITNVIMPSGPSASRTAMTNAQGQFVFERLPAGQFSLNVNHSAWLAASFGQKKPGGPGTTFKLVDGQKTTINMQLVRGGVITGVVFGEAGEPLSNTQIRAWRYTMNSGVRRLQQYGNATTDDRGVYRLFGLQAGDYLVSSTPNANNFMMADRMLAETALIEQAVASGAIQPPTIPGQPATVSIPIPSPQQLQFDGGPPGYLPVYHPSSLEPSGAVLLHVVGGDEHANVDIQVRMVQTSNIQGSVTNLPTPNLAVQLSLVNDDPMTGIVNGARTDPNGRFFFRSVAPGKYTIVAQVVPAQGMVIDGPSGARTGQTPLEDSQKWWGRASVSVQGEPSVAATISMQPGRSISGQVIFEMTRPPDLTRSKLMVTLGAAPGVQQMFSSPQGEVGQDGRFTITGVAAGRYTFGAPGGLSKSAMVNGEDTLDFPLDFAGTGDLANVVLTVTDKPTEISGVLTDSSGQPSADYTIVAIASEERYWTPGSRRIAVARPNPEGRYTFRSLPPGTYLLAAVAELESGGQYDPEFLKSLAAVAGMHITLIEGEKVTKDLRVGR
jgi:protocatechuate 3,4-dioxygenase beta subunit